MKKSILYTLFASLFIALSCDAAITLRNGKIIDADAVATLPVQEHFSVGLQAVEQENWAEGAKQFRIVTQNFPSSPYAPEGYYYLGVSEFFLDEIDFANEAFSAYLKAKNNPKFFQEAIEYKFAIAEKLRSGYKKRFFGMKQLPKWAPGSTLAMELYDEVIAALPCHDVAARALYSKAFMLWNEKQYKRAVDSFQLVIKRFPKNELAPESYVAISQIFLEQSRTEFQNPDVLEFAQINLRRFKSDFPREERIQDVEEDLKTINEVYAKGVYDTGLFYERVGKPMASVIYYQNAIRLFPNTEIAQRCMERLEVLQLCSPR